MDPSVLSKMGTGPQADFIGQTTRNPVLDSNTFIHHPWTIQYVQTEPTEGLGFGSLYRFVLTDTGDLLHRVILRVEITGTGRLVSPLGTSLIKTATFRGDSKILDKIPGEFIQIQYEIHKTKHTEEVYTGYDRLNQFDPSGYIELPAVVTIDIPFWFRRSESTAIPLFRLDAYKHEFLIQLRPLNELVYDPSNAPTATGIQIRNISLYQVVSNLTSEDRQTLKMKPWVMPISQTHTLQDDLAGRSEGSRILDFPGDLWGILFGFRSLTAEANNQWFRFNNLPQEALSGELLNPRSWSSLYLTPQSAEFLAEAELRVGTRIAERREAWWWRDASWREAGLTPPDRIPNVYGRFWCLDWRRPSGTVRLENLPRMELAFSIADCIENPNLRVLIYGLRWNRVSLRDRILVLDELYEG
jgi:hypothetical protein